MRFFQARILKWVAITFSRGSSWPGMTLQLWAPAPAGTFFITEPPGKFLCQYKTFLLLFRRFSVVLKKIKKWVMSWAVLGCPIISDFLWCHGHRLLCPWGFSRQEYWSGLTYPPPGDLPNPGIKPRSPALQENSLQSEPPGKPKTTGIGSLSLPHGIFMTQGLKPPALQVDSLSVGLPRKPKICHRRWPYVFQQIKLEKMLWFVNCMPIEIQCTRAHNGNVKWECFSLMKF